MLEGTINLAEQYGSVPSEIYLAVGVYATADGGALNAALQLPGTLDSDGNLDAAEFLLVQLVTTYLEADFNTDGYVNQADLAQWLGDFGQNDDSDADGDGDSDGADFLIWQRQYGQSSIPGLTLLSAAVPEPGALVLGLVAGVLIAGSIRRHG